MIKFEKNNNTLILHNNKIMLVIYINSVKRLETVYFGKFVNNFKIENYRKEYKDNYSTSFYSNTLGKEIPYLDGVSTRYSLFEIGNHALDDDRPSPIIIKKANGNYETSLLYVSHKIYKGYPKYTFGPHVHDGNAETLEITLTDEFNKNIRVLYNISIDLDKNIIVKNFELINDGNEQVNLLRAMSLQLDLPTNDYNIHHFGGFWADERNEHINNIIDGEQIISSTYGRSSHEENPFFFITKKDADMNSGEVIGFNLIYSGNFKASIFSYYSKQLRITYGINDYNFDWVLSKGEHFITPQAVISYSFSGIDPMSQTFHRFVKENIITYKENNNYKSVIFNSWEGCEMSFNTESLISYIDDAKKINAELFVLDDGWFSTRNDEFNGLGDWWVNKNKVDLHKIINYCHEKGMKFGLWFEPEMVNYNSELFQKHPDYILGHERENQTIHRHQLMLDFTNDDVVENIYKQMCQIIDEYPLDYIKWDHNRDLRECFVSRLESKKQGEVTHRIVLGYYKLIENIVKKYPFIMIEGCASGGGRFDLGTLYYTPQIWCSDNTSVESRRIIQYNTSFGYPLSSIGSHVSKSPDGDYYTKSYLALFGTYGYEMNPNKLNKTEIKQLNEVTNFYKNFHKDLFENGLLYHLKSPQFNECMAMEVVALDKSKAAVLLVYSNNIRVHKIRVALKGLDPSFKYKVSICDTDIHINGNDLNKSGIDIKLVKDSRFKYNSLFINLLKIV